MALNLKKISCFLILAGVLMCLADNVWAQNPSKVDGSKTGAKYADWVQKQHENYNNKMEELSESQFGQTIGKGINGVKNSKKFVMERIQQASDLANDANKEMNNFKNSKNYKSAMLSKDIALKGQEMANLKQEREQKLKQMKEDIEIEKEALIEKIRQAKENMEIGAEILSSEADGNKGEIR